MSREFKKAFIGLSDIASVIDNWGAGFEENNIKTLKGSMYYQHPIQNSKLHFVIEKYPELKYIELIEKPKEVKYTRIPITFEEAQNEIE